MPKPLLTKTRELIREMVRNHKSKTETTRIVGVCRATVTNHTPNMPKGRNEKFKIFKSKENTILEKIKEGFHVEEIAREYNMSVYRIKKLRKEWGAEGSFMRGCGMKGRTLVIMKEIMENGYIVENTNNKMRNRSLRKHFPIKTVKMRGSSIHFMEGREEVALKEFLRIRRRKIISNRKIGEIRRMFGIGKTLKRRREKAMRRMERLRK